MNSNKKPEDGFSILLKDYLIATKMLDKEIEKEDAGLPAPKKEALEKIVAKLDQRIEYEIQEGLAHIVIPEGL